MTPNHHTATAAARLLGPAAFFLFAACGHAPATDVETSNARTPSEAVEAVSTATAPELECPWRVDGDTLVGPYPGEPVFTEDLRVVDVDGVAPEDAIADLGNCGTHANCVFVVLRGCEHGGYEATWGPEYALDVEARRDGEGWATLVTHDRAGRTGCDIPLTVRWTRDGDTWSHDEACRVEEAPALWDPACGDLPPLCEAR